MYRCRKCNTKLTNNNWKYYFREKGHRSFICWPCQRAYQRINSHNWRIRNLKWVRIINRKHGLRLKRMVLGHYSPKVVCIRCGYGDIKALSIDHIKGNGAAHRRKLGSGGLKMYGWLKKHNYPKGFQVLCMNCQFVKKWDNYEYPIKYRKRIWKDY